MSVGERAMTRRISAVAVCCSSASFVSPNSRAFSIAIAACLEKVVTSWICVGVNGSTRSFHSASTPMTTSSRKIGTPSIVRKPPIRCDSGNRYSRSARTSSMWTVRFSSAVRPMRVSRPGRIGCCASNSRNSGVTPP